MKARYDIQLMVQVSKMYYLEGMTQEKIARQLEISRSAISMVLSEARDYGIVQVSIKDPKRNVKHLANQFIEQFSLKGCLVIPTGIDSPWLMTKVVASQGADYAGNFMKSHSTIGIAWGSTCYEFMMSFKNENKLSDINVVPMIGGTSRISSEYQLNEMVRMFAEKLQGSPSFIYAPAIAESIEDKELYMKSMSMKSIVERWNVMDAAVVSAGAPPEYYSNRMIDDPDEMKPVYEDNPAKPVGDICARRFNIHGDFLKNDYSDRTMGIDGESLGRVEDVFCIAAGKQKVLSIIGALRTSVIDHLIVDEPTAKSALSLLGYE